MHFTGLCYLWGPAEKQAAWMRRRWGFIISVMLPCNGPLAVVHALLCPLQVLSDRWPQRAAPGHIGMRQQREGAQLSARPPRQEVVGRPGQDDGPRRHPAGLGLSAGLRRLAGPLGGRGRWGGGGRGRAGVQRRRRPGEFGGVGDQLGIALLFEFLGRSGHVRGNGTVGRAGGGGGLLRGVGNIRGADAILCQGA